MIVKNKKRHNTILNILEKYREIYGSYPDVVISGFHMEQKSGYAEEDLEVVRKIALELKKTDTKFYTGHCTGEVPYQILKECLILFIFLNIYERSIFILKMGK